jgi:hypothetical protein
MKRVRFIKYLNNNELTNGVQYAPDQVAEFSDNIAAKLVSTFHAEYMPELYKPKAKAKYKRTMDEYEQNDYDEVVP